MKRRFFLASSVLTAAAATTWGKAFAQSYPNRPIRLIVGAAPGGSNDLVARLLAEPLSRHFGQQVVVENMTGMGGRLAARYIATQKPGDGYAIFLANRTTLPLGHLLYPDLKYDPLADFEPVARIASTASILLVNKDVPARNLTELIKYGRDNPGALNYGSVGPASPSVISFTALANITGATFTSVPYQSNGQLLTDLSSGHAVQLHWDSLPTGIQQVKTGRVRALAIDANNRSDAAPDIPTVRESFPDFRIFESTFGILAPAGTPEPVLQRVDAAIETALRDPKLLSSFREMGMVPLSETRDEMRRIFRDDMATLPQFVIENKLATKP